MSSQVPNCNESGLSNLTNPLAARQYFSKRFGWKNVAFQNLVFVAEEIVNVKVDPIVGRLHSCRPSREKNSM